MNDFLNESEEIFTKEKIEELIFLYGIGIKGMTYVESKDIPEKAKQSLIFLDSKLNVLSGLEFPDSVVYLGAHDEIYKIKGNVSAILGKFNGKFTDKEIEIYTPIVYFEGERRGHDWTILNVYESDKKLVDFYIPGIFKALNEKGYGIEYIRHSISVDNEIRIRVKTYEFKINTRGVQDFFDEGAAKKMVKVTTELYKFTKDFNRLQSEKDSGLEPRYTEGETTINTYDLLELMRTNDIDFEDVKVNHKGISSIYDTGLFERKLPDFVSFISEAEEAQTSKTPNRDAAIYYLTNLSRNYTTVTSGIKNPAFENLGEKIRLQELRLHVKDKETNSCDGYREIHCKINDDEVLFKFDFDVKFSGQHESDSPDAGEIDKEAVFVRLEDFIPTKFEISSPRVTKVYTNFSKELKDQIQIALIGLFEAWYDILGKDLEKLKITQL